MSTWSPVLVDITDGIEYGAEGRVVPCPDHVGSRGLHVGSCRDCQANYRWPGSPPRGEIALTPEEKRAITDHSLGEVAPEYINRIVELGRAMGMLPWGRPTEWCLMQMIDPAHRHTSGLCLRRRDGLFLLDHAVLYRRPDGRQWALLSQEYNRPVVHNAVPHWRAMCLRGESPYGLSTSAVVYLGFEGAES